MSKPKLETLLTHKAYLASKWNHHQMLLDEKELEELFSHLKISWLFPIGKVVELSNYAIATTRFLQIYQKVIENLKKKYVEIDLLKEFLPIAITKDTRDLYLLKTKDRSIVKMQKPTILMQMHTFYFSNEEKKFRSMILGPNRIFWGLQFSYPQIYQDPETKEYFKVDERFSSTKLFVNLRRWTRSHTLPTPFLIEKEKINVPIRLGKQCFSWINHHPELEKESLKVVYAN